MIGLHRPSEKDIQKSILDYLTLRGYFHWRNNTGAFVGEYKGHSRFVRYGRKGSGDIVGVLPDGRFFSIEVKREDGVLTDDQKDFIDSVNRSKGIAFVARGLDDVIAKGF